MKKFTVYVIESIEGYKYTGLTEDIELRLTQHNEKLLSKWTKRGNSWQLKYTETFTEKSEALKREKWLKSGAGRDYLRKMIKKSE